MAYKRFSYTGTTIQRMAKFYFKMHAGRKRKISFLERLEWKGGGREKREEKELFFKKKINVKSHRIIRSNRSQAINNNNNKKKKKKLLVNSGYRIANHLSATSIKFTGCKSYKSALRLLHRRRIITLNNGETRLVNRPRRPFTRFA